ncbi:4'-phosphopantetheinyl transferase family protein [Streptomyces sp. NPDC054786]
MAPVSPAAGPPLRRPRAVAGPQGPWHTVHDDLSATGVVLVYGRLEQWLPHIQDVALVRPVLGRDWHRYQTLTHPRAKERFLASRLLLRYAAAVAIETAPDLVDLAYQPGGRPFVRGCDQIDISLSHTEEVMVVGITSRGRVGVDVELAVRRMAGTGSEAQGCTPYERQWLDAVDDRDRNDTLVRLWTLKEAYSKALGQGLRFRFTEFGFALDGTWARLVGPDGRDAGADDWVFATFAVDGKYVVSAAVQDAGFGGGTDLSVQTALDAGLLDALLDTTG